MTPQEFTHSQGDALRTVQEILEAGEWGQTVYVCPTRELVNLAKCFIELENTIKNVRDMVKEK